MKGHKASYLSTRGVKFLIALPLLLAAFALLLQWSGPRNQEKKDLTLGGLPKDGYASVTGSSRVLGDLTGSTSVGKKEDTYVAKNEKTSELWRPGSNFKPTYFNEAKGPKLAFVTTTSESFKQIKLWIDYHKSIGVNHFYLFVDGQAARPDVSARLRAIQGVTVIPRDEDLKYRHAHSRIWNETWLAAFFHKPCNHELFVLQSLNMEAGIELAAKDGIDWILHIDTDELVYPGGGAEYSIQRVLASVPSDVDTLVFPNYESLPERDDVQDPFTEVTLFKRNYHHVVSDSYFKAYHTVARGNPNYFITYGNGKSAARIQAGLRPNGAHRWYNYNKAPKEETSDEAAVLHFTYNRFDDLKSRRDRCDCAPTEEDAKRCFILPFDRMAFLAASLKTDAELLKWFRDRLIWNEPETVVDLLKNGLFVRLYEPQVVIRGFMAADEALEKERDSTEALQPPPGQAAAGAANMGIVRNAVSRVQLHS
ncbi:g727 [Coccomyxa viridis]|uniref:G727 protein n=1 Tax=Coccomyxa viridis TaxID=1274662 RepID=A0ABP1FN72_9CHLO